MAVILEINTKKTLYEPREIKIDAKVFHVRPITLGNLEAVQALQQDAMVGSAAAIRKMLELILDGPIEILVNLEMGQLDKVITAAVSRAVDPEAGEKNESRPEENKLLS